MSKTVAKEEAKVAKVRSPFVEDAILRETVKKESMFHRDYTEFHPSIHSLYEATPDKPLVSSLCSKPFEQGGELEESLKKTLNMNSKDIPPQKKYPFPQTTSQEIGWDINDFNSKSLFDHKHKKTDVTSLPSKWDPNANVMATKSKKGK